MNKSTYTSLVHSKYYNPAFNAALFDGPLRIYFSQSFESLALKVYFSLQQKLTQVLDSAKLIHEQNGKNILILIYPNTDSFQMSFEGRSDFVILESLEGDDLLGVNGPFEDQQIDQVLNQVKISLLKWNDEISEKNVIQMPTAAVV